MEVNSPLAIVKLAEVKRIESPNNGTEDLISDFDDEQDLRRPPAQETDMISINLEDAEVKAGKYAADIPLIGEYEYDSFYCGHAEWD